MRNFRLVLRKFWVGVVKFSGGGLRKFWVGVVKFSGGGLRNFGGGG